MIDLRSDTVTRPTPGMLEAMFNAKVGDDVFRDDPSVNALEEKASKLFGMKYVHYFIYRNVAIRTQDKRFNLAIVKCAKAAKAPKAASVEIANVAPAKREAKPKREAKAKREASPAEVLNTEPQLLESHDSAAAIANLETALENE